MANFQHQLVALLWYMICAIAAVSIEVYETSGLCSPITDSFIWSAQSHLQHLAVPSTSQIPWTIGMASIQDSCVFGMDSW
jgi:hypothetical protein